MCENKNASIFSETVNYCHPKYNYKKVLKQLWEHSQHEQRRTENGVTCYLWFRSILWLFNGVCFKYTGYTVSNKCDDGLKRMQKEAVTDTIPNFLVGTEKTTKALSQDNRSLDW